MRREISTRKNLAFDAGCLFTLILWAGGLLGVAMLGLWGYVSVTATPLHPDFEEIPSVTRSVTLPEWTDAAKEGGEIVRTHLVEQNLPGLSVAVGIDGEIVWAEGFGWADLEQKIRVTPETQFRIGTASTPLTSAAVGVLLEKERLKLDDLIQTYVPEFPEKEWPVTIRQLMGHSAGVRTDGGDEGPLFSQHVTRPVDALPFFAEESLLFQPGTEYRFSSYGWILISAAIEAAAHEPFLDFIQKQVFEPLGMADTMADTTTSTSGNRATSYFPRFAADPRYGPDVMRDIDLSAYAGASVFLSTPSDLVRFGMGINGGQLLRPATVQLLQTSQQFSSGLETGYGLGWNLETVDVDGERMQSICHDGELLGGEVASLVCLPEYGIVVSVTSNISYADTSALAVKIAEVFVGAKRRAKEK